MKLLISKSSVLLALFIILFNTSFSQCYTQEFNHSGSDNFYSTSLSDLACEVKGLIELQSGVSDFPVAGFVLYPVMAYADPHEGYEALRDNIEEQYFNNDDNGIYFIKAIQPDGNVEIFTVLNLPAYYDTIYNPIELLSIANEIINEADTKINSNNIVAESAAMLKLLCLLSGTCDPVDPIENSGFKEINFGEAAVTYTADGAVDENQSTDIYDLAGLKVNDEYIRIEAGNAVAASNQRKPALIITSDIEHGEPNGYTMNQQLIKGNEYFESSLENSFVVWMHFKDNGKAYYKTKINFSEAEAKSLIEHYFDQAKNDLIENGASPIVGNPKDSQLRNDDCDSASCNNIFKLNEWSAKCCILPGLADDAFVESILTGTIDGMAQLVFFLYDMGKGLNEVAEATPFTLSWFKDAYDSCVKEGSILKGMGNKLSKDKKFWSDLFNTAKNILDNAGSLVPSVLNMIFNFIDELNPLTGPFKETGYALGLVVFELVMAFLTGGTSVVKLAAVKFTSITKAGLQTLRTLDVKAIGKTIISGFVHTNNTVRNKLCRIGIGGCFVKDTPVLMAKNPFKNVAKGMALAAMPLIAPIQNVQVDDMVKAYHHEDMYLTASSDADDIYVLGWQDYDYLDITPETWQVGKFVITEADGSIVEIEANRPKKWFEDYELKEKGDKAFIVIEEMGIADHAILQEIRLTNIDTRDFILNEKGKVDRPVITTYKRIANEISDYTFSNGQIISCTPNHPFYSSDRETYLPVVELIFGEAIQTSGDREVKFIGGKSRGKGEHVYNFEVWREHNYYVGFEGVEEFMLVHNSCAAIIAKVKKMTPTQLQKHIADGWDVVIVSSETVVPFFKSRRYFEELMVSFRYVKNGLKSTNPIAPNFKALDAFKETSRALVDDVTEITSSLAVSMKTTKIADVTAWLTSKNIKHLEDLKLGLSEGIEWASHKINYSKARLDIYMPKSVYTPAKATQWKNHLKELYPELDFDISTLEKHLK